ncbi:MAG: type IV toxin-antitoxin system AbiEi family antitoxin domain-containing protein [Corynebacterium sp.]|uniref:type IV toxin-antitoxin system AbiEi family antitoxin domain-containing protein n=1 Tax=Corynebacterium sp. TaxID=1720 RepID=UPI0026DACFD5|nr:type IV toxin-antitoxin system AbiEi family antitoxin domain-containing protein [Corynebacterium sp.]MDO5099382.1 type IV toxin-antitoxin system AbiEi family antitoxin domain-containing protein [Corynebacterium sp.]
MKNIEVLEALELAASEQWGIITTAQAQREGVSRLQLGRLADKGVVMRVRQGVYLLPSAQHGPFTDIRVAWVALGGDLFPDERWELEEKLVVSHESAALIHRIGDLIPAKLTFTSTTRKQTSRDDIYIYVNRGVSWADVVNVDGLPVTSVERTVADLATKKIEFGYLATIVVEALQKEGVRSKTLSTKLDGVAGAYGFTSGQELVLECQKQAETEGHRHEIESDLPPAIRQILEEYAVQHSSLIRRIKEELYRQLTDSGLPSATLAELAKKDVPVNTPPRSF